MNAEIKERIEQVQRGEVPMGHKHTPVGIIPVAWQVDKLEKHLDAHYELSNDTKNIPVATSSRGGIMLQSEYYQQQRFEETQLGYHVVPRGFVTYRHMSDDDIFRFNVNDIADAVLVSPEYPVFTTRTSLIQSVLIYYLNTSPYFLAFCRAQKMGGTRTRMYFERLQQFLIPIPPIAEQKKIAEILIYCEKIIGLKEQLIEEKRYQKKWLMQNLLNPDSGVRLPGFEESEWASASLGELFSFGASLSASRDQLGDEGILYMHYGDIHANGRNFVDVANDTEKIPRLPLDKPSDKTLLRDGDVVFVDASEDYDGVSKYVVVSNPDNHPFISGLHTIPARSKGDELRTEFKRYCFQTHEFRTQMAYYANGMKVYGISKNNLSKVTISFPSQHEQSLIAGVLSTADREIDLLEQELTQWQTKKKSLMQLLLTGIVRVTA